MEHKYPDVQFILNALAASLVVPMVSPLDSVLAKTHQPKAHVFSRSVSRVLEEGRLWILQAILKEGDRQSLRRRIKHLKRHQRKIPRFQFQRQSWYHILTAAGDDQTARLLDSRRRGPGMRSGDVLRLRHLHRDDERVGGHRQAAQ